MLRPLALATPAIALLLSVAPARAQTTSDASGSAGDEATLGYPGAGGDKAPESPGAYTHDGFYLRLAAGGGYVHDNLKYEGPTIFGLAPSGEAQGASFQGDLAAGWAIKPGLVIGGQLYVEQVANPSVTLDGKSVSTDVSVGTLTMFGPFIDWYVNPHGGFHFGGMLGGARVTMKNKTDNQLDNQPIGGGGMAFVGYEWWIGKQWAFGLMAQFAFASMKDSDTNIRHTWTSGGLAATVTFN